MHARTWRRSVAAVLAIATATTLAACGSARHVTAGGKVILKVESAPTGPVTRNFNPYNAQSTMNELGGKSMIYESLYLTSKQKTGSVQPWLAKSWKFSPDGLSLTATLQTGVAWSDGTPFTAADVAFSFNLMQKFPSLNTTAIPVEDATAVDPDTVRIDFSAPAFTSAANIGYLPIVSQHIWSAVADPVGYADVNPIGTGPFTLDSASFSPSGYTLVKNPHYWQAGLPKIDGLQYVSYDSNTSANLALENGELDWAGNFVPNIDASYVGKDPKDDHYWFPPTGATFLCLNLTLPKYQDVTLRKAISTALDRPQLVAAGEQNEMPAMLTPTGLILPNQAQYLDPSYQNTKLTPDPAAAKASLIAAGYTYASDGTLIGKDGRPVTMTLSAPTAFTDTQTTYQVMAQQLKAIGIDVTIHGGDLLTWIAPLMDGAFDGSICGNLTQQDPDPYATYYGNLSSALIGGPGKQAFGNFERWSDPATDALLTQYASTTDPAVKQNALNGLQKIMVDQVPVIPIDYGVDWGEYSTKQVTGWPSASDPYATASPLSGTSGWVALHLTPVAKS